MFVTNIWFTSALTVTAIFSASALYKSYSDIQEAKQIQEHYEIISDIKVLLSKKYNKSPQAITRDEIIANLPTEGNWDKVLLLDRSDTSTLSNKEFLNSDGEIVLDKDEKLKLLAIKAKIKDTLTTTSLTQTNGKYNLDVGFNKNIKDKDKVIEESINNIIYYMIQEKVLKLTTVSVDTTFLDTAINDFIPLSDIYQDLSDIGDSTYTEEMKKKLFFKKLIKQKLEENRNSQETKLYAILKDLL